MATDPWAGFEPVGAAPAGGPVYGPPPKPAPAPTELQIRADARAERADARAEAAAARAANSPTGGDAKNIPEVSARGIQGNLTTLAEIEGALAALEGRPQSVGPGTGFFGDTVTQFNDPSGAEVRAVIGQIGAAKIHDLSGAAVSAQEAPRFTPFVPSVTDRPDIARTKLERFRDELLNQIEEADAYYSPANGYMPYTTPGMEAFRQRRSAEAQREAPPALGGGEQPPEPPQNIPGVAGTTEALSQDSTRTVANPIGAGLLGRYRALLGAGKSGDELVAYLESAGITDPETLTAARQQAAYRRAYPRVPLSEYTITSTMQVPLSPLEQGINNMAQNALGPAAIAAGDAYSGFNLDSIVGAAGGNAERARAGMDQIAAENPKSSLAGTVLGGTLGALSLEGGLGAAGIAPTVGRSIGADTLYGMAAGAGGTDYASDGTLATGYDRLIGAGKGGLAALVTSGIANRALGAASRPPTNPSVAAMQSADVPMTLGQMVSGNGRVGAMVKGVEDRVAGMPIVGDMINARRREGVAAMNTGAFNKALEPIGARVAPGAVGPDALAAAQQEVQAAFGRALGGRSVTADARLGTDLTNASARTLAIPRVGGEVGDSIQEILAPYMQGTQLTGEAMQAISRELRILKAGYAKSEPALANRIGKAIDATEEAIFGLFRRQAPDVLPAYNAAKQAYRRVSILADAVNTADNQTDNLFTAAQLNRADKANAKKYEGSLSAAAGPRQFREYAGAAQDVLPNTVPDSGTAGRIILPVVAGGMVGADAMLTDNGVNNGTLTLAAILAGAYTKAGQRLLTKPSRGVKSAVGRAITSDPSRKAIGGAVGSGAAALTTQ